MNLLQSFETAHPEIAAWWANSTFDFALSLKQQAARKGELSPRQIEAALRCIEKLKAAKAAQADAPAVDTTILEAVFARVNPTLRKPALNVGPYRFSPAPDTGANPGAIYVKQDGEYLGKMLGGRFLSRATAEVMNAILGIAADPLGKAIEHGKITGRCAICNRKLTDEDSTDRGIGPICYSRIFAGHYGEA